MMMDRIDSLIYRIRDVQIMLDSDLAALFNVETKVFNQAVKRNSKRFPMGFRFQLSEAEYEAIKNTNSDANSIALRSQIVTLNNRADNDDFGITYNEGLSNKDLIANLLKSL